MASYQEKSTVLFGPVGQKAAQQLVAENPDLFLSIDEEQAFATMVSHMRLHMDELEFTNANTPEAVLAVYRKVLGALLHTRKITVLSHGLSTRGKQQFDALVGLVHHVAPVEDPKIAEYKAFNGAADTVEYQLRLASDEGFRQWANSTR